MVEIVSFAVTVAILLTVLRLSVFVVKRLILMGRLATLKRDCGAEISYRTLPLRPMWMTPRGDDITVRILDTVYHIRLYSGVGPSRVVHFASERYSVVSSRIGMTAMGRRRAITPFRTQSVGARVVVLPQWQTSPPADGTREVRILLFSPAPNEVSYVTEEKTSIRLAFTGDELYGQRIFTASTFVTYAERKYREELAENAASSPW